MLPRMYVPTVLEIDPDQLQARGIRALLLDLDNTIIPRDETEFSGEVRDWLDEMRARDFKLCVVSNNGPTRVGGILDPLGVPYVVKAIKPLARAFRLGMQRVGATPGETAVVGDQIFTDILGGNLLGLYTILVVPMQGKEFWATSLINRRLEKPVLRQVKARVAQGQNKYQVW